jgi:hypothetical protein
MFSDGKTCPECHTTSLRRSHRRKLDWIFHVIGYWPVRCSNCCERFYAPRLAKRPRHTWA